MEIVGRIRDIETIAAGEGIHDLAALRRRFGPGRWRKRKGVATVRLSGGAVITAEVHWYEAHGVGRRDFRIKRRLPDVDR